MLWTETLLYWIKNTIRINYLTLLQPWSRLKNQVTCSLAKKAKRGSLEAVFQLATEQAPMTETLNMKSEDHYLPKTYGAVQNASPALQDHYVIYNAKAAAEMGEP